jgi:deazaflavin-dependent oxidoreductase (nitroreductase family)
MPYLRPGFIVRSVLNPPIRLLRLQPVLAVRGRRSGVVRATPVTPISVDGARYLVSPRGQTHWARNLRAAGTCELRTLRGTQRLRAQEVSGDERERVLAAYRRVVPGPIRRQLDALPDPADHPVFRLEAA